MELIRTGSPPSVRFKSEISAQTVAHASPKRHGAESFAVHRRVHRRVHNTYFSKV